MDKNSKIYIAGHSGLVGSAILRKLNDNGYTNLLVRSHKELDLLNQRNVEEFMNSERPEYVIMAAAKVGGIYANNKFRAQFIYENIQIQSNIIHYSYLSGVKKLLFFGSTCIYPGNISQPIKEEDLLTGSLEYSNEPYAIAKISGLKMCESYNLQYGTNFISVMPTNLYGPNDNFDLNKGHVIPALVRKFHLAKCLEISDFETIKKDIYKRSIEEEDDNMSVEQILKILEGFGIIRSKDGIEVVLWGSGKPVREFLWSEDLADATIFLLKELNFNNSESSELKQYRNSHINIGTSVPYTIKELSEIVRSVTGFKGRIVFDLDKSDGTMVKMTCTKRINNLGWKHKVNLNEGIEMLYKHYLKSVI